MVYDPVIMLNMKSLLHEFFLPHENNNFRAKILHNSSILLTVLILFLGGFFLSAVRTNYPSILGVTADISIEKLLLLTNMERQKQGLPPLAPNPKLLRAALLKADDMFTKNYWAHNSPDGTTPWYFIREAGYNYTYAGENLARGFETAEEVVKAWMASPKHRANVLSENFNEVGFAIEKGRLNGEETVLIVEAFGNQGTVPSIAVNRERQEVFSVSDNEEAASFPSVSKQTLLGSLSLTSNISKIVLSVFILVLALDILIVKRKRIIRFVGHNLDHIFFLGLILLLIISTLGKGVIV